MLDDTNCQVGVEELSPIVSGLLTSLARGVMGAANAETLACRLLNFFLLSEAHHDAIHDFCHGRRCNRQSWFVSGGGIMEKHTDLVSVTS